MKLNYISLWELGVVGGESVVVQAHFCSTPVGYYGLNGGRCGCCQEGGGISRWAG